MEKKMETTAMMLRTKRSILGLYWIMEKKIETTIMENQMEKKNEMDTVFMQGIIRIRVSQN